METRLAATKKEPASAPEKPESMPPEQRANLEAERDFEPPVEASAKREGDWPDREASPPTKAEYQYVASAKSDKFHYPSCSSASRINPENLVFYKSRDEALGDGKEPCKRCSP